MGESHFIENFLPWLNLLSGLLKLHQRPPTTFTLIISKRNLAGGRRVIKSDTSRLNFRQSASKNKISDNL